MSEAVASLKKINPIAFILLSIFVLCLRMILSSSEPLTTKLVAVLVGGAILFLAVTFEVKRVTGEEEAWKGKVGSG